MNDESAAAIADCLRCLARDRGPSKTFCPSEAARLLDPHHWREIMPDIRAVAASLAHAGELRWTQRGTPVDPATARGAIRLSLPF